MLTVQGFYIGVDIARDEQRIGAGVKDFNINVGDVKEKYMFETVSTEEDRNAIEVIFNSNKSAIPITIKAHTYAKFYIFIDI